ncbi:hypothetical protein GCM10009117_02990 [Gangjinia marincola]|uniref:BLUF domain-containing protein n=1 Tax=Gangjinia marincola TaxID=578463 RepID=A0ABN1MDH1_9FLAO
MGEQYRMISYVSTLTGEVSIDEVKNLLCQTECTNNSIGIKGMLLFHEGHFFQYLSGEKSTVSDIFNKITCDHRHHAIQIITDKSLLRNKREVIYGENEYKGFISGVPNRFCDHELERYTKHLKRVDLKAYRLLSYMIYQFYRKIAV